MVGWSRSFQVNSSNTIFLGLNMNLGFLLTLFIKNILGFMWFQVLKFEHKLGVLILRYVKHEISINVSVYVNYFAVCAVVSLNMNRDFDVFYLVKFHLVPSYHNFLSNPCH